MAGEFGPQADLEALRRREFLNRLLNTVGVSILGGSFIGAKVGAAVNEWGQNHDMQSVLRRVVTVYRQNIRADFDPELTEILQRFSRNNFYELNGFSQQKTSSRNNVGYEVLVSRGMGRITEMTAHFDGRTVDTASSILVTLPLNRDHVFLPFSDGRDALSVQEFKDLVPRMLLKPPTSWDPVLGDAQLNGDTQINGQKVTYSFFTGRALLISAPNPS